MNGNDRCPCGSGKKFKRCCRNQGRPLEQCFFCKKTESPDRKGPVQGRYAVLKGTEQDIWSCEDCITEQQGGDNGALLLLSLAASLWSPRIR
jgi:hypothetical protein